MRGLQWSVAAVVAATLLSGCSGGPAKRSLASTEPGLSSLAGDGASTVVAKPRAASTASFADRHPLLYKPREYYDKTNNNKAVKTAAGAFLGVPAGIYGELKQVVVGAPPTTPAY